MTGHIIHHYLEREAEQHAHERWHPVRLALIYAFCVFAIVGGAVWCGTYGDGWQFEQTKGE